MHPRVTLLIAGGLRWNLNCNPVHLYRGSRNQNKISFTYVTRILIVSKTSNILSSNCTIRSKYPIYEADIENEKAAILLLNLISGGNFNMGFSDLNGTKSRQ